MSQDDRLGELEAFAEVAGALSLTTASRRLNVAVSSVSRRIARLEERLATRLVERTTRRVQLTEAGRAFLPECVAALDAYARATERLQGNQSALRGRIRVSLPSSFGRKEIVPLLPAFVELYPDISLDLVFSDRLVDLTAEGFDLAIRIAPAAPVSKILRPLGVNRRLVCASPAYLTRFGVPTHPMQLSQHRCLSFSSLLAGDTWTFQRAKAIVAVDVSVRYRANDADAIRALAIAGEGIAIQAEFNATDDLATGRLRRVLMGWRLPVTSILAQVPNARFVPRRVDAVIQHLRGSLPRYLRA